MDVAATEFENQDSSDSEDSLSHLPIGHLSRSLMPETAITSLGLSLLEILDETKKQGKSFAQLLAIPEHNDWVYTDGKLMSCVGLVVELY
ncbi:hypothetical protein RJ641_034590 [Dillenia turbinata]|uniref:Uncharacterized protein n=1 Tax=Dillenia turbinata TaxID=194707 RepID=A0AAN8VHQ7_9MAGN